MTVTDWLLDPSGLTPHGFCLSWVPGLIWLHAGSDAIIGLSYFSIPLTLAWFVRKRGDLAYRWVGHLFMAFILACGLTHMLAVMTLWVPAYGVEGLEKLLTALLSVATAVMLWPVVPRVLALPTPAQLSLLNAELTRTVEEQSRTAALLRDSEAKVLAANSELERRVAERTAELSAANAQLTQALAERAAVTAALRAAKSDLEEMVAERTAALKQRDLLLREVYHRVKNNLQVIDGLVMMQSLQLTDPEARQALAGLRSRVYALGLVHQQLMASPDLETFDIAPFLQELASNILQSGADDRVSLRISLCPLTVNLDFAIPLGLLVTELITNSLKHAFPDGQGTITMEMCRRAEGDVLLVIADDGTGAAAPEAGQPAGAYGRGVGSMIMKGLVGQLDGTMTVRVDQGTRVEIILPAPPVGPASQPGMDAAP
ncbi:sensor histidine kinase [Nitrospirillum pindoramense]|uniref:histidine kinase n=1 Tax=Nitrospirillum amazonense TaxID=28077 RepID=A0A560GP03_9PROT|nr:histidine kinase dimerization/phosphoacceptor domain -containing protein [Nitrospirillum amazonense]TWB35732.1 two-component sensor histidine kinase [Nitrospirillum amazonense]